MTNKLFQADLYGRNRYQRPIINSNFDVWQRGTAARTNTTTYSTDTSYAADRFFTLPAGASVTTQQSSSVPNAKSDFSALLTGAASVTTVDYGQRIRAAIVRTMCRRMLVFEAQVFNNSGAAFIPNLRVDTPSARDNFTTITNRLDQALQSCPDGVWTRVWWMFDPSGYTNIDNGMQVCLRIPSGSLVAGDTVNIAQFDCRPGTLLLPYEAPDADTEWVRARHYYQRYGPGGSAVTVFGTGYAFNTTLALMFFPFRQQMRVIPTMAYSGNGDMSVSPGIGNPASMTLNGGDHAGRMDITVGAGLTAGVAYQLQAATTTAWIELRAEL